ncbi:MAG TPA: radical SAM protein, partial [Acidobacteriota bacterium]
RVDWPLVETDLAVERMAKYEEKLTRLCISMVTHGRAFQDTADIIQRIGFKVRTPLSILVAPPTLNRDRLQVFKDLGVDMIGVGLDAVTKEVFLHRRTNVPQGGLSWDNYWEIINGSREIFGPWKVNCHVLVGLGESDRDLVEIFYDLKDREIFAYLFCFNPEPDSRMGGWLKSNITRWRTIQLVKTLIEEYNIDKDQIALDSTGAIVKLKCPESLITEVVEKGVAFMTNGCPGESGEPGCTRPYGSYRPAEPYRDYPFLPEGPDLMEIRNQLQLSVLLQD